MREWLAWSGGWNEQDSAERIKGHDAGAAAENFVEKHYASWDYPAFAEVCVQDANGGPTEVFDVFVEAVPHFAATKRVTRA